MDLNQETDCKSVLGLRMKGLRQLDWRDAKICVFSVLFCQTLKYRCKWSLVPSVFSLLCTQMMCAVPMQCTDTGEEYLSNQVIWPVCTHPRHLKDYRSLPLNDIFHQDQTIRLRLSIWINLILNKERRIRLLIFSFPCECI